MQLAIALLIATVPAQAAPEMGPPAEPVVASLTVEPSDRLRIEVDYLYWFLQRMRVPPLLTTSPPASAGVLGTPGTEELYGDGRLRSRHDRYVGVRFDVDYWLSDERTFGLNVSGFFLERDSSNFTVKWHSVPVLARPYIDANDGSAKAYVVAGPSPGIGDLSGAFNAYSRVELFGQDANLLFGLVRGDHCTLDVLAGARFLQIRERLDLTGVSKVLPDESVLTSATDHFHTFNKFYGAQAGLIGAYHWGRWSVEGKVALAIGGDDQEIRNYGDRIYQTPQLRQTANYGVYVLPSNRGNFDRGDFDFVTETTINVGCDLTRHIRTRVGYTLLTWLNPVRPGDQIGPLNLGQVAAGGPTGPAKPTVPFREDFFWAQGLNVGLELRW